MFCILYRMILSGRSLQTCEFIDSYNFMLAALAKLPKCFGLQNDLSKLYFPHLFNTPANLNRRLNRLPRRHFYAMHNRSSLEYKQFRDWYQQNCRQPFCLREQLPVYCEQDVRILREACVVFRQTILREVGLDPFAVACTIAGLTMTIYRHKFLPPQTMVNTPEKGTFSIKYLRFNAFLFQAIDRLISSPLKQENGCAGTQNITKLWYRVLKVPREKLDCVLENTSIVWMVW
jgi:hypothetical protein